MGVPFGTLVRTPCWLECRVTERKKSHSRYAVNCFAFDDHWLAQRYHIVFRRYSERRRYGWVEADDLSDNAIEIVQGYKFFQRGPARWYTEYLFSEPFLHFELAPNLVEQPRERCRCRLVSSDQQAWRTSE